MSKRGALDQESTDGDRRTFKRFKVSPATPINPVATPLERRVAHLLKIIQDMPPKLLIEGFDRTLDRVVDEAALATPGSCNDILRHIDEQIKTLKGTEKIQGEYDPLVDMMIIMLNGRLSEAWPGTGLRVKETIKSGI